MELVEVVVPGNGSGRCGWEVCWEFEVEEDFSDDGGIGEECQDDHRSVASRASERVEEEDSAE